MACNLYKADIRTFSLWIISYPRVRQGRLKLWVTPKIIMDARHWARLCYQCHSQYRQPYHSIYHSIVTEFTGGLAGYNLPVELCYWFIIVAFGCNQWKPTIVFSVWYINIVPESDTPHRLRQGNWTHLVFCLSCYYHQGERWCFLEAEI